MRLSSCQKALVAATLASICGAASSFATNFNVPGGDLNTALDAYIAQSGVQLLVPNAAVRGVRTKGVKGDLSDADALSRILRGTGFVAKSDSSGALGIVRDRSASLDQAVEHVAAVTATAASGAALETVTVTSSKIGGDVQNIPIAITALSQEQLTATQTAGGPDLIKQVPNMTFTKTNFTGYSINIRGIGTQAISVTTDPAVAVAFDDIPFIRNHFFEQEFYDLSQAEVLRGPQGTLYGRNATAGVVNIIAAKPTDQFEGMASADIGNYQNRRLEAMINIPIVDDRFDLRIAGEWTKRQGYSFNELTDSRIDGRDLWSSRVTLGWKPTESLQTYLIWEHFSEDDDRLRSSKQLCKTDPSDKYIDGIHITDLLGIGTTALGGAGYYSQGCLPVSLYSPQAFEVPNGEALPYVIANVNIGPRMSGINPYSETTQSNNLRVIESTIDPTYHAKNNLLEFNADYSVTPVLSTTSQTGFNQDFINSTEDYSRFDSTPDIFLTHAPGLDTVVTPDGNYRCLDGTISFGVDNCLAQGHSNGLPYNGPPTGVFCDPQLGCSSRLAAEDMSRARSWQLSQEFRVSSHFPGPFNFSAGGNYLHYETAEDYFVFINALTLYAASAYDIPYGNTGTHPYIPGVSDNSNCAPFGFTYPDLSKPQSVSGCDYIDPNPISKVNGMGHNYFRSYNPYTLNSYAMFGETEYNVMSDLKLTAGLRWTEDRKHFIDYPSEVLTPGWGYPSTGVVDQQWDQLTGRFVANWTPKLGFTDQTLIYGSYAHGYKAGGANPPGAILLTHGGNAGPSQEVTEPIHPLTFKPEFVDAFEIGSKNSLLDGTITLNGDVFYYNYENYQISEIVDRTSINLNFDAHVKGAELETTWEPAPGFKFTFAGGYEDATLAKGSQAVDLMDRTAGTPGWFVKRPFITQASNCILPISVLNPTSLTSPDCGIYVTNPGIYNAPNNGQGFDKDLSGNQLPNAPHFTTSLTAEYTLPISGEWAATLHSDFYWQSQFYGRVFNDIPYDQIHGYSNMNLALIFTSEKGWQILGYLKNVFNTTAITGTFLNSDDTGLTTNVFLTDPRLVGIRVTKNW